MAKTLDWVISVILVGKEIELGDFSDIDDVGEVSKDGSGGNDGLQLLEDRNLQTDAKVSMYSYHQRLTHYIEEIKINQQNRKAD
jgi:hypothetical protein